MDKVNRLTKQVEMCELSITSIKDNLSVKGCLDKMLFAESMEIRMMLYAEAVAKLTEMSKIQAKMTDVINELISES